MGIWQASPRSFSRLHFLGGLIETYVTEVSERKCNTRSLYRVLEYAVPPSRRTLQSASPGGREA